MRISTFPADQGACSAYRLRWPAQAAADQGHDVRIDTPAIRTTFSERFDGEHPPPWVEILAATCDTDTAVIQRPLHRQWLDVIPMLQAQGVRCVVELDDNFDVIHRRNAAWHSAEPDWLHTAEVEQWTARYGAPRVVERHGEWHRCSDLVSSSNRTNIALAIQAAGHLVVSTPALADHYGQRARTVRVVRNRVPERYLRIGEHHGDHADEGRRPRVMWTGSTESHPNDLQQCGRGLANITARFDLVIVGTGKGVDRALRRRVDSTSGWVHLDSYPAAYAHGDIAICPLELTAFNRSKSFIKPLEAAALGVVPVMSPTPEYLHLHSLGVGLIARSADEWNDHVGRLVTSRALRCEMRAAGLEVAASMTVEGGASEFVEAWSGATESLASLPVCAMM